MSIPSKDDSSDGLCSSLSSSSTLSIDRVSFIDLLKKVDAVIQMFSHRDGRKRGMSMFGMEGAFELSESTKQGLQVSIEAISIMKKLVVQQRRTIAMLKAKNRKLRKVAVDGWGSCDSVVNPFKGAQTPSRSAFVNTGPQYQYGIFTHNEQTEHSPGHSVTRTSTSSNSFNGKVSDFIDEVNSGVSTITNSESDGVVHEIRKGAHDMELIILRCDYERLKVEHNRIVKKLLQRNKVYNHLWKETKAKDDQLATMELERDLVAADMGRLKDELVFLRITASSSKADKLLKKNWRGQFKTRRPFRLSSILDKKIISDKSSTPTRHKEADQLCMKPGSNYSDKKGHILASQRRVGVSENKSNTRESLRSGQLASEQIDRFLMIQPSNKPNTKEYGSEQNIIKRVCLLRNKSARQNWLSLFGKIESYPFAIVRNGARVDTNGIASADIKSSEDSTPKSDIELIQSRCEETNAPKYCSQVKHARDYYDNAIHSLRREVSYIKTGQIMSIDRGLIDELALLNHEKLSLVKRLQEQIGKKDVHIAKLELNIKQILEDTYGKIRIGIV